MTLLISKANKDAVALPLLAPKSSFMITICNLGLFKRVLQQYRTLVCHSGRLSVTADIYDLSEEEKHQLN